MKFSPFGRNLLVFSALVLFVLPLIMPGSFGASTPSVHLVKTISTGNRSRPEGIVSDPKDQKIFVFDTGSSFAPTNISVISTKTNKVIDTINLNAPTGLGYSGTFDQANDQVYFAEHSTVYAIMGSTDQVVAEITSKSMSCVFCELASNGAKNEIYVANSDQNVTVISGKTDAVTGTLRLPSSYKSTELWGIVYDPASKALYVSAYSVVLEINPATGKVLRILSVPQLTGGNGLEDLALNGKNNELYADGQGPVIVISTSSNKVVATVKKADESSLILADPENGNVYSISISQKHSLYVINGATNTLTQTFAFGARLPYGIAFAPSNKMLYVADWELNGVYVIST